jgi:hypothetical protein
MKKERDLGIKEIHELYSARVSEPIAALIQADITFSKEEFDDACKWILLGLVGHPLNEVERMLVRGWLTGYLFPPSKAQVERENRRYRAHVYNMFIELFDRRGVSREEANDFILKIIRKESGKDVGHDAVDQFLRRAEKGGFGEPVPRYRNQFSRLDLEAPPKWRTRNFPRSKGAFRSRVNT